MRIDRPIGRFAGQWTIWRVMVATTCILAFVCLSVVAFADDPPGASSSNQAGSADGQPAKEPGSEPSPNGQDSSDETADPDQYHQHLIDIVSASYGNANGFSLCSAHDAVKRRCQGRQRCSIPINDSLCLAAEVQPVLIPSLIVRYRCYQSQKPLQVSAARPFSLTISCRKFSPAPE